MEHATTLVVGGLAGVAGIITAYSAYVRARGEAGRGRNLVNRLVDWYQQRGHEDELKATAPQLHHDVTEYLSGDEP